MQHVAYRMDGPTNGAAVVLQHGYSSQKEHWFAYYVSALVAAVSKNGLFEPFIYINAIVLPRQARDKHRENSPRKAVFPQGYRCISIDSLGHGDSASPPEKECYGRAARAADIIAVMDAEGVEKAHVCGYRLEVRNASVIFPSEK